MEQKLTYNLAVRLFSDEKCFGPGVAQLLHRVQELHSLRAAAMSMNMAYSKAWTITKHAQAALGFPLLHSITGGRGGGGAELTPEGERLLEAYDMTLEATVTKLMWILGQTKDHDKVREMFYETINHDILWKSS